MTVVEPQAEEQAGLKTRPPGKARSVDATDPGEAARLDETVLPGDTQPTDDTALEEAEPESTGLESTEPEAAARSDDTAPAHGARQPADRPRPRAAGKHQRTQARATPPPATRAAAGPVASRVPRPAPGTEFFGEYQGSGYAEPRYLARRADGQVVQLTLLLDLVLRGIDGTRDLTAIARKVTEGFGREVTADNLAYLIEHQLQPAGLVLPEDGGDVPLPRTDLLLVLRGHRTLVGVRQVSFLARTLAWLHRPLIVAAALLGAVAFDVWLFAVRGAIGPLLDVLSQPLLILIVLGLGVASMLFHEFGHASACWYSGARPGRIGCGIFLIWPSMYTDVTDVYRCGRAGRLRTDLGGVYFNTLFVLALAACYAVTGQPVLLAAIVFVHLEIVDQLLPVLRFDGYFLLADLVGVPDLFGRVRPILRGLLPTGPRRGRGGRLEGRAAGGPGDLRRGARVAVTAWVLVTVPLLLGEFVWMVWHLPALTRTTARSATLLAHAVYGDALRHQWAQMTLDLITVALLAIPVIGLVWLAARVVTRFALLLLRSLRVRRELRRREQPGTARSSSRLTPWSRRHTGPTNEHTGPTGTGLTNTDPSKPQH